MKKRNLIIATIMLLMVVFSSCDESIKRIDEPSEKTTKDMLVGANEMLADSTQLGYYIYHKDENIIVAVNMTTMEAEYDLRGIDNNNTGILFMSIVGIMIGAWIAIVLIAIFD